MNKYEKICEQLRLEPKTWLLTGVAGFIGSNLLETLLKLNQKIIGLDNFATGYQHNLDEVKSLVEKQQWGNFRFINGDIRILEDCQTAVKDVDYILHQAALGSVPRSLEDPITSNETNVSGFLNMLVAARDAKVESFTYAASSSTYGDHPALPKTEDNIGKPLSPYAVTKYVNELYADVFSKCYGFNTIGLRYFNVFGSRQDPNGAYAAVIPKWIDAMLKGDKVFINGDGETSRDFCYIDNTVQMNILAATAKNNALNQVYNVAAGEQTSLNKLFELLQNEISTLNLEKNTSKPIYRNFRAGDVLHSLADIDKAKKLLGYDPQYFVIKGIEQAMPWYISLNKHEYI